MSAYLKHFGSRPLIKLPEYEEILTQELWKDSTVVITYLRRFNCVLCRQGAMELSKISPLLRAHGIKPVIIGLGAVGLKDFQADNYFDGEVYLDSNTRQIPTHGFKQFNRLNLRLKTGWDGVTECSRKEISGRPPRGLDHAGFECGGTLIVEKGGKHIILNEKLGGLKDHVTNGRILQALGIETSPPRLLPRRRKLSVIPDEEISTKLSDRRMSWDPSLGRRRVSVDRGQSPQSLSDRLRSHSLNGAGGKPPWISLILAGQESRPFGHLTGSLPGHKSAEDINGLHVWKNRESSRAPGWWHSPGGPSKNWEDSVNEEPSAAAESDKKEAGAFTPQAGAGEDVRPFRQRTNSFPGHRVAEDSHGEHVWNNRESSEVPGWWHSPGDPAKGLGNTVNEDPLPTPERQVNQEESSTPQAGAGEDLRPFRQRTNSFPGHRVAEDSHGVHVWNNRESSEVPGWWHAATGTPTGWKVSADEGPSSSSTPGKVDEARPAAGWSASKRPSSTEPINFPSLSASRAQGEDGVGAHGKYLRSEHRRSGSWGDRSDSSPGHRPELSGSSEGLHFDGEVDEHEVAKHKGRGIHPVDADFFTDSLEDNRGRNEKEVVKDSEEESEEEIEEPRQCFEFEDWGKTLDN